MTYLRLVSDRPLPHCMLMQRAASDLAQFFGDSVPSGMDRCGRPGIPSSVQRASEMFKCFRAAAQSSPRRASCRSLAGPRGPFGYQHRIHYPRLYQFSPILSLEVTWLCPCRLRI